MQKESDAETLSVWCYLNEWNPQFVNVVYEEPCKNTRRLRPAIGVENIVLWNDLYMGPVVEQRINAPVSECSIHVSEMLRRPIYKI